jgi:hypothetical protein
MSFREKAQQPVYSTVHSRLFAHTSAIRSCDLCRFPERELWCVDTSTAPALDLVERNFERGVFLYSCPRCATLWFLSGYGKYGEFLYAVRWPLSLTDWRELLSLPRPPAMSDFWTATRPEVWQTYVTPYRWHRARVHARWSDLTESEVAEIHRMARIMPHSIPVEEPMKPPEPEPDLSAVLDRRPFDVAKCHYTVVANIATGTTKSFSFVDQHRFRERDLLQHERSWYIVRNIVASAQHPNDITIQADDLAAEWRYRWAPYYRFTDDEADEMRREIQAAVSAGRKPNWEGLAATTGGSITDTPLFVQSALARDATGRLLGWWARRRRRDTPIQPLL